ncbi:MAG: NADH dehydrogenase [Spirochaetes bacterium GWD1_27_9]|nr:MAG: NADH dehydrogenase [Spirochaetes bacterium GWB1_27_13]OHD22723.1 MAG: NADH dehydrogenase [Spirochaetes bacterium GWC1_27_15]OHD28822.1 MAG: NADH dehydrogenase [Spirochaetes bacterium GWD1_27_9]
METNKAKLDQILKEYSGIKGALIPILQKTQESFGYLSQESMGYIANSLKMSAADIYGVATFYTQFRFTPVGKYVIKVCHGTACHVGGIKILDAMLESKLDIKPGETTKDGLFSIQQVACLGCCSLAPVVMISDKTYGKLTNDKLGKIIDQYYTAEKEGKTL